MKFGINDDPSFTATLTCATKHGQYVIAIAHISTINCTTLEDADALAQDAIRTWKSRNVKQ